MDYKKSLRISPLGYATLTRLTTTAQSQTNLRKITVSRTRHPITKSFKPLDEHEHFIYLLSMAISKKTSALAAIILAAGKGTRMKSALPKVLHEVAGRPMLHYPLAICKLLKVERTIVVIGYGKDRVEAAFVDLGLSFVTQVRQLGTGHAVMTALPKLKGFNGSCLILSGDVPLITKETLKGLVNYHHRTGAALTLVSAILNNPAGYGRIVRNANSAITQIIEDKDCDATQRSVNEINAGIYLIDAVFLRANIRKLGNANAQGEFYLPDLVRLAVKAGKKVSVLTHLDSEEIMGINNRVELSRAGAVMRRRISIDLMRSGVTIVDPDATYIDHGVTIGVDSIIHPNACLKGDTAIGANCVIEEGAIIKNAQIGDNTIIKAYSVIDDSKAGNRCTIGPFARLRPGAHLADEVHIGNFVEVKKSTIGKGSKANHLTYLGDAEIGAGVNIGAGTITCNYDGVNKFKTTIKDNAFIGSDSQLVAPVTVGKGAYVGSGTTVTKDVPDDALVVTRAPERVIKGWGKLKRESRKKKKH